MPDRADPSPDERRRAARAHLSAWLGVIPLFGLFTAFGIYSRAQPESPWVAQQALLSALFQTVTFNATLIVTALAVAIGFLAWDARYDGNDLVLAAILTGVPLYLAGYVAQAVIATRAARAVLRGQDFRHRLIGGLVGAPAPTAAAVTGAPRD